MFMSKSSKDFLKSTYKAKISCPLTLKINNEGN